jgi:two-component system, NarL family, nitrate/nitrite response regulator NarL
MDEPVKVVIVEDHEVSLTGLKAGLANQAGIEVVGAATTSGEGLSLCRSLHPDVVLLDLHLPDSTNPRAMVKEFCSLPGSRVLIFSVENRQAFIETVLEIGAAGYLLKSESIATVANTIKRISSNKEQVLSKSISQRGAKLTGSEQEVLKMLARGMKYQTMADLRKTTAGTVRKQCEMLQLKLGLETREELIAWAVDSGYGRLEL